MAANYNADIRIGITGKTQLNSLEKQLGRINKDLIKINKGLKAQTLTINTKGATRALDQLDRKINKLNRSISVNATINEKTNKSSSGGGTLIVGGNNNLAGQLALAKAAKPIAKALTNEAQDLLDTEEARNKAIAETLELRKKINDQLEKRRKLEKDINTVENSSNEKARTANMNRLFGGNVSKAGNKLSPKQSLALAKQESDRLYGSVSRLGKAYRANLPVVTQTSKAYQKVAGAAKKAAAAELNAADSAKKSAAARSKFGKGFTQGAGLGLASGLGSIPVLGEAAAGGLAAQFTGASVAAGALGGAVVGIGVALAGFGNQAVKTATQVNKLRLSLELAAGSDFDRSLETISTVVEDFNTPIETATTNFTKLYASAQGSGIAFNDLSELFINLSAANKAFAGDAEDLNGILRAFTQIISKGTVQSEELKGQVGERLPGAFALAAKSLGMTTAELQKALENGEVKSKEFVEKFGRYMRRFRKDADVIADAPEEAGARLTVALQNLQVDTGQELARLGAQFQNFTTQAIKELTRLYNFLGQLGTELENRINKLGGNPTQNLEGYVKGVENANDAIKKIQADILDPSRSAEEAKNDQRNLEIWYQSRKDFQAKIDALKMGPPVPTAPPAADVKDELEKTESGSGSKSGPRSTLADTQLNIQLQRELLAIEKERTALIGKNDEMAEFALQQRELEKNLIRDLAAVDLDNLDAASKEAEKTLLQVKYQTDLVRLTNEQKEAKFELQQAFDEQVRDLELSIALEEAITEEQKAQLRLKARLAEINAGPGSEDQKAQLSALEERLQQARDGNQGVSGYMKQLQSELMDTEGMIISLSQTVVTELGTALSDTFSGLIDGTKTAQEAFADMFKNIGKAFLNMAAEIIAKQLVMIALQALFKALGGSPGGVPAGTAPTNFDGSAQGLLSTGGRFSGGGYTGDGPRSGGLDGEGGFMAMLHPQETVIDHSRMDNYGPSNGGGSGGGAPVNINYTGPRLNFNQQEYLPVSAVPGLIKEAAAAGEKQTLGKMRNSPATRRRVGI